MSSGVMNPLQIIVGLQRTSLSPTRYEILPSLAAAKPFAYTRRPISQICSLILRSLIPEFHWLAICPFLLSIRRRAAGRNHLQRFKFERIENGGVVGLDRFHGGIKRGPGFGPFADG